MKASMQGLSGWRSALPILLCLVVAAINQANCTAADQQFGAQTLTMPHGFTVQRVAGPPLVERPISFDFDERGRLYVSESSGTNDPVAKQLAEKPHRILRLEDTDRDGLFDKRVVFADGLMLPQGTMWLEGSLYVSAPPSIWKLTDNDDDGVAEQREEWFQGKTLTGCANDLHGPYRGRDGWIYWCKGAFAEQQYDLPGRPGWKTRASHIFRCRADGSGLEPVMTGGMDNPVDVAITPAGERILSATFLQNPGGGRRDGLIHAIYGGVYGKEHGVLDGHRRTGDLLPALTHLGPAAPCGLHYYESQGLGDDVQGNLFACQFNLHKVSRHKLVPQGASFITEDSDFLSSDSTDFHPTDVIEDADGSLLVCDTGGWYKLCCPTSQLHKPDVLGSIYRVSRTDMPNVADPRGAKLSWGEATPNQLLRLLDDDRPAVRQQAIDRLATVGSESLTALEKLPHEASEQLRLNRVWTLTRIDSPTAKRLVREALTDGSPAVRQTATHSVSVRRDRDAVGSLVECLSDEHAAVARAAAEGLGRLGDARVCGALLTAVDKTDDPVLEHSIVYALIEIGDSSQLHHGLASNRPRKQRASLIALEQIKGGALMSQEALPLLDAPHKPLRDAAWWVTGRHSEWGEAISHTILNRLSTLGHYHDAADAKSEAAVSQEVEALAASLAKLANGVAIQKLIAQAATDTKLPPAARRCGLRAMVLAAITPLPGDWLNAISQVLRGDLNKNTEVVSDVIQTLRSLPLSVEQRKGLRPVLLKLSTEKALAIDLRLSVLEVLRETIGPLSPEQFSFLQELLKDSTPPLQRTMAAGVLEHSELSLEQRGIVAKLLRQLGAMEITRLLPTFVGSDTALQTTVLQSLDEAADLSSVRRDVLSKFIQQIPKALHADGERLLAKVETTRSSQAAHLEQLAAQSTGGDVRRGHAVFNSKKAACIMCHAMGYVGGQLGPDLSRVGQIRTERDLLEAIIYPSASFVRSYEPVTIRTVTGQDYSGLLLQETQQEVVLSTSPQVQQRILKAEIEAMLPGQLSLMPTGYDKLLTPEELADVIAYLKNAR